MDTIIDQIGDLASAALRNPTADRREVGALTVSRTGGGCSPTYYGAGVEVRCGSTTVSHGHAVRGGTRTEHRNLVVDGVAVDLASLTPEVTSRLREDFIVPLQRATGDRTHHDPAPLVRKAATATLVGQQSGPHRCVPVDAPSGAVVCSVCGQIMVTSTQRGG